MQCVTIEPKPEIKRAIGHMKNVLYSASFAHFMIIAKLLHKIILRLPAYFHWHYGTCATIVFGDDAYALLDDFQHKKTIKIGTACHPGGSALG